jgi:hypothetical protein
MSRRVRGLLALGAFGIAAVGTVFGSLRSPAVAYFEGHADASWVVPDLPPVLHARRREPEWAFFRRRFELGAPVASPTLRVRGFETTRLLLDDTPIGPRVGARPDASEGAAWKEWVEVELPDLERGAHTLVVCVANWAGPPALIALSEECADLSTGQAWEWSGTGESWSPVRLASDAVRAQLAERYGTVAQAVRGRGI